jgi:hypothetical protein
MRTGGARSFFQMFHQLWNRDGHVICNLWHDSTVRPAVPVRDVRARACVRACMSVHVSERARTHLY